MLCDGLLLKITVIMSSLFSKTAAKIFQRKYEKKSTNEETYKLKGKQVK